MVNVESCCHEIWTPVHECITSVSWKENVESIVWREESWSESDKTLIVLSWSDALLV